MNKKAKIGIIILVGILMVGSILLILLVNKNAENQEQQGKPIINPIITEPEEETPYIEPSDGILANHDKFFTIQDCILDLINTYNSNNNDATLGLLDINYANENGITSYNIHEKLSDFSTYQSFEATKIEYEDLNERVAKYKITGNLINDVYDADSKYKLAKFTVFFDQNNMTFSIALSDNFESNANSINVNQNNKYSIRSLSNQELAKIYYYDLKTKIVKNDSNLDEIINGNTKITREEISSATISTYEIQNKDERYIIQIVDTEGRTFNFSIKSVYDYTVSIAK